MGELESNLLKNCLNNNLNGNHIRPDIRQWSGFNVDFETRIEVMKMNVVPRLLYLLQSIPSRGTSQILGQIDF